MELKSLKLKGLIANLPPPLGCNYGIVGLETNEKEDYSIDILMQIELSRSTIYSVIDAWEKQGLSTPHDLSRNQTRILQKLYNHLGSLINEFYKP